MRRSVQPNCPRAMTCCFFASLKILAMSAERLTASPPRQRLERLLPMAGFQVSIYVRFWVSTEVGARLPMDQRSAFRYGATSLTDSLGWKPKKRLFRFPSGRAAVCPASGHTRQGNRVRSSAVSIWLGEPSGFESADGADGQLAGCSSGGSDRSAGAGRHG